MKVDLLPNAYTGVDSDELASAISKYLPELQQPNGELSSSEDILKVFSGKIRRAPIQGSRDILLQRIGRSMAADERIQFVMYHGARKNPNAVPYKSADLADAFSLGHLTFILNRICEEYKHGAEVTLITTGQRSVEINKIPIADVQAYGQSLSALISNLGYSDRMSIATLADIYTSRRKELEAAENAIRPELSNWWVDEHNRGDVDTLREHAKRFAAEGELPEDDSRDAELDHRAFNFKLRHKAEHKINLLEAAFPNAIYLTYDAHSGRAAIPIKTSFGGNITQPWQGAGGLVFNSGQYIPYTVTQDRAPQISSIDANIKISDFTIQRGLFIKNGQI